MSILGNRVLRREDPKFLTTGGVYTDDLPIEGAVWATYVRSTVAHARLPAVDGTAAADQPGVVAVLTGADLDLAPLVPRQPGLRPEMARPLLATGTVRFVGEPVAVVLTERRDQGEDAAEAVIVDYDPLPAVVDPLTAADHSTLLFPEAGTNVAKQQGEAPDDAPWAACEVVVRQRMVNQRVAPCPLEVRAGAAEWGSDGRLTQYVSNQAPHGARRALAAVLGVEEGQVRVVAPDVGGGFGAKISLYPEELLLGWLARQVGRPVRWSETRSESMVGLGHGRAQLQDVTIGGTRDGRVLAYRLEVVQDAGAYPVIGAHLPTFTRMMASGTYDIPTVQFTTTAVVTNTTPVVAYRGAGRPEATTAIERAMDLYAAELGLDPVEVRRRNLVAPDRFPFTTPTGAVYDCGDYARALDLAVEASGYARLREEQARRRAAGDRSLLGIGVSTYVEITNVGGAGEYAAVEVRPDGGAQVLTGTSPHGQGHVTAWSMLVAEQLGIPMEDIEVVANDTDVVPSGGGTMGSRSLQAGGLAVHEASVELVDLARKRAADALEADPDDVVLDRVEGRWHVAGTPAVFRSWADLAADAAAAGGQLRVEHRSAPPSETFPFGSHVAVVEVDAETGRVRLVRLLAVDDAGTILNPLLAEGQRHGGLAQGAAQALLEEVRYDSDGNPVTANLADYAMVSATELPSFELVSMETPTPVNALGAKGIGESGTIGSTPAVQSAVVDALAHLGVRHLDMPASPERVWSVIATAAAPNRASFPLSD
ncbi:MAG TPA: xanthine dehydrogenase family protein molybdopterin-binding subunit [Acidimicrobiales bacterium]|nr:xanthine dehydrogenase family protein molybdopterin-binding subunit [Acidimicrobiales bacterium]